MLETYFPRKYQAPVLILGIAAILVFIFGRLFDLAFEDRVDRGEASVLVQSIPFASTFITIILIYILLIFIVAIRFNGKIPYRTYRPVELTIIGGIMAGVFAIFQPWEITSYKNGFILLLGSTIAFILWSHVKPQSSKRGDALPSFINMHHFVGFVVAVLVFAAITLIAFSAIDAPVAPYGYTDRIWNRGLREEQRLAVAERAEHDYDMTRLSIALMSVLPAAVGYFIGREVAASWMSTQTFPVTTKTHMANVET